ncbi:MAG: vacuolar-type H+-ATPase subunit I/STV1 [Flavobacteriales bacterium]|jgi:vacuolar-type H+-ATPase subunit I/STV1
MNTITSRLEQLTKRVLRISEQGKMLKEALQLEKERGDQLEKLVRLREAEIKELQEQNELIKVAGTIAGGVDANHSTKGKISELVREIDKCIALLNG